MTREARPPISAVLAAAEERLRLAGVPEPRREAARVMAIALGTDRGGVAVRKLDALGEGAAARFEALLSSRIRRMPIQYLLGREEFRGLDLEVGPSVLIPREETEGLVQAVLDSGLSDGARVIDLGTGSGCIAIALASERPAWSFVAVDASAEALSVARVNAHRHQVSDRIEFVAADFGSPEALRDGSFDAVVSNPPYVAESAWRELAPEVRDHEPKSALVPGPTGNEAYGVIAPVAARLLVPGGLLALELGFGGESAVRDIVAAAGFLAIAVRPDMQGIPRVLTARRPGSP